MDHVFHSQFPENPAETMFNYVILKYHLHRNIQQEQIISHIEESGQTMNNQIEEIKEQLQKESEIIKTDISQKND